MTEGIDISYWQGAIDFAKVTASGKKFAIVRGGDGSFVDPRRTEYADAARAAGMAVECYHFLRLAQTPPEAEAVCRASLAATGAQFLWLDMEDDRAAKAPGYNVQWLHSLSERLQDVPRGIYTGNWWWGPWMGNSTEFAHLPLWVADYTLTHINRQPKLFAGWQRYHTWQYSSSGSVDGIAGDVDLNWREQEDDMFTDDDRAVLADIQNWVKGPTQDKLDRLEAQSTADLQAIAKAVADELAKRLVS